MKILGAYGVSRFTNWRFHEITETGQIRFEWFMEEMYTVGEAESDNEVIKHNKAGFDRIKKFGIRD
ncbi:hypothetical protein [Alteromonas ponticola]|uniref:Uncharacterized protein n=1 Tax=Alteromonas ponticola TaxID=2720613 RepID=A0ABX1QWS2_9ALTE|nr:hypothetical protein [Alteromonas ponticola]NMH58694.1 hypothetical protein [Alteromonas ponticola]